MVVGLADLARCGIDEEVVLEAIGDAEADRMAEGRALHRRHSMLGELNELNSQW